MTQRFLAVGALLTILVATHYSLLRAQDRQLAGPVSVNGVSVAVFDDSGALVRPDNMEKWVFLGASLGMGYNGAVPFDPDTPGNFQTVLMEPTAFDVFQESGVFPDGSMFALLFHGTRTNVSINQSGFVMDDLLALEIHLKDKARFPDTGFNFFFYGPEDMVADAPDTPNGCTSCHTEHGETQAVFTQFYPTLKDRLSRALNK